MAGDPEKEPQQASKFLGQGGIITIDVIITITGKKSIKSIRITIIIAGRSREDRRGEKRKDNNNNSRANRWRGGQERLRTFLACLNGRLNCSLQKTLHYKGVKKII